MNSDLPTSLVGGRVRPCRLFTDPFSSPVASFGEVSETDSEVIPRAPLKQRGGLKVIRRKYGIHSSVQMRSSLEFEHAPDGGPGEIAIFEVYLVAISSFLGFYPSQLTPSSWKTLISIQVLGELYVLPPPPRDGAPLVEEPSRGTWGSYPFGDNCTSRYVFMKIQEPFHYPTFWRTVDVSRPVSFLGETVAKKMLAIPRRFRGVHFLMSKAVLRQSNIARLHVFTLYDEYQQAGARRRRPFYAPPPRLTRVTPPAARTRPLPSRTVIGDSLLMGVRQRLFTELFLLRNRVRDMAAQRHNAGILKKNSVGVCLVLKDWIITLEGALKYIRGPLQSLESRPVHFSRCLLFLSSLFFE
ncbi:hypothetical protein Bca52824_066164 [Brassica carinata]|uniref:Uncharacterized protein n=1 Tax=Brassica carinata TaxID=52824 RepID=A0A8X7QJN2_BRACI|nr:hypothetical protein Bca52824_066164 [Brassica carinata]